MAIHPTYRSWFDQIFRNAMLIDEMMQHLDIDPGSATVLENKKTFIDARDNCASCAEVDTCRNWLDASEALPLPPEFCPNSAYFGKLLAGDREPGVSAAV